MSDDMIYTITNKDTLRRYPVIGKKGNSLDTVWLSEKCWFSAGARVTISTPDGRKKTFTKEN